jgi:hypothetical protein
MEDFERQFAVALTERARSRLLSWEFSLLPRRVLPRIHRSQAAGGGRLRSATRAVEKLGRSFWRASLEPAARFRTVIAGRR